MSTFSETRSLVTYMQAVGSMSLNIVEGKEKVNPKTGEAYKAQYVQFIKSDGTVSGTAMLASKVSKIDASNARDLDVSWVEGATEAGTPVKGYMVHTRGVVTTVSTFSIADLAAIGA